MTPDVLFGSRSGPAGKLVSKWLRGTLGITDPAISPNHSWRHWWIDAAKATGMHLEVRSAITGHSARLDESAHYGHGTKSFIDLLAKAVATIKLPEGVTMAPTARPRPAKATKRATKARATTHGSPPPGE